ncbi:hypothetical protein SAURM35S_07720 [Streptomyces aurantiogriseus]
MPSLNAPHSGLPCCAQKPSAFFAQSASWLQVNRRSGQSRASAIGFGIAMVSGLCTIGSAFSGNCSAFFPVAAAFARDSQELPAGAHTSGFVPSDSSQPSTSVRIASPEFRSSTLTCTHLPSAARLPKALAARRSGSDLSTEAAMVRRVSAWSQTASDEEGAPVGGSGSRGPGPSPAHDCRTVPRATAAATSGSQVVFARPFHQGLPVAGGGVRRVGGGLRRADSLGLRRGGREAPVPSG